MPIVLKAVPEEEYMQWVAMKKEEQASAAAGADKEWSMEDLVAKGKEVYSANCASCHMANGQGLPGTFPALDGSPIAGGGMAADHISLVLKGKNLMPAFSEQLNDVDLAAVITYERNSWSNKTGDVVQPADVAAAR